MAAASSSGLFDELPDTDLALAWLGHLFRDKPLPDSFTSTAQRLGPIADALHKALGFYSTGMLVLAGILLFYNLAILVLETAHYGIALGRRSAQIWAPIRLVFAIALLVPVGSGLNTGQYVIVRMTEVGSSLASHIWHVVADNIKDNFSGIIAPEGPDTVHFVTAGVEMEACRSLYHQLFSSLSSAPAVQAAGDITTLTKAPRTRFAEETWRYSNTLNANIPLCGAYRFASAHRDVQEGAVLDSVELLDNELADFSRTETDQLVAEARSVADGALTQFLGQPQITNPNFSNAIASLADGHKKTIDTHLATAIANGPALTAATLSQSADAGWITAGSLVLELARLQEMYGSLAAHVLPAAQIPAFAEGTFVQTALTQSIASDPLLRPFSSAQTASLTAFYLQMASEIRQFHDWLDNQQLANVPLILSGPYDLQDQLNAAGDPEAAASLFARIIDEGASVYGVWNSTTADTPLIERSSSLFGSTATAQNAITALAEFGRRQQAFGHYLFGIAAPDLAPAGTMAYVLLLDLVGLVFVASGLVLTFLLPLLPFFRFFLGILAWLLGVFEAMVAIPVVALAHLNFTGEGLSGGTARQAYLLWLNIIIRPVLTLFGFAIGLLLFAFAMIFLGMVFDRLTSFTASVHGEVFVTMNVVLTLLYTILAYAAANAAFKGITLLPDQALHWLGGFAAPRGAEAPAQTAAAPGLPSLSVPSTMINQGSASATSSAQAIATARAASSPPPSPHSLKAALFPFMYGREGQNTAPGTDTSKSSTPPSLTDMRSSNPLRDVMAKEKKPAKPDLTKEKEFKELPKDKDSNQPDEKESDPENKSKEEAGDEPPPTKDPS
jgi:conjugal transfer/type IV secretion protein DotA/TraY